MQSGLLGYSMNFHVAIDVLWLQSTDDKAWCNPSVTTGGAIRSFNELPRCSRCSSVTIHGRQKMMQSERDNRRCIFDSLLVTPTLTLRMARTRRADHLSLPGALLAQAARRSHLAADVRRDTRKFPRTRTPWTRSRLAPGASASQCNCRRLTPPQTRASRSGPASRQASRRDLSDAEIKHVLSAAKDSSAVDQKRAVSACCALTRRKGATKLSLRNFGGLHSTHARRGQGATPLPSSTGRASPVPLHAGGSLAGAPGSRVANAAAALQGQGALASTAWLFATRPSCVGC